MIGTNAIIDENRMTNALDERGGGTVEIGVRNRITDLALFGQGTLALGRTLRATLGMRWSYARMLNDLISFLPNDKEDYNTARRQGQGGFCRRWPSTGRSHRRSSAMHVSSKATGRVACRRPSARFRRFSPTRLTWWRGACVSAATHRVRCAARPPCPFQGGETSRPTSMARMDLIPPNVGTGRIFALEANAAWRMRKDTTISGAIFINDSRLTEPADGFENSRSEMLPNIARLTARAGVEQEWLLDADTHLTAQASARYVGRSWLGVGPDLHIRQGASSKPRQGWRSHAAPMRFRWTSRTCSTPMATGFPSGIPSASPAAISVHRFNLARCVSVFMLVSEMGASCEQENRHLTPVKRLFCPIDRRAELALR